MTVGTCKYCNEPVDFTQTEDGWRTFELASTTRHDCPEYKQARSSGGKRAAAHQSAAQSASAAELLTQQTLSRIADALERIADHLGDASSES